MASTDNFAFLLPVMMLTFGCTFLIVARFGSREARHWGAGYIFAAAAFSMPLAPVAVPAQMASLIADALFLAAFYFYGGALLCRFSRPSFAALRIAFASIIYAATLYPVLVAQSVSAELLLNDFACASLLSFTLFKTARHVKHRADALLLAVSGLVVMEIIARNAILIFALPSYGGADGFLASDYAFFMQAGASVLALFFALSALGAVTVDTIAAYRDVADRDPLTGLLNRRGFERVVTGLKGASGAVVVCDIDHFKRINDVFGHAAGDTVIIGLAQLLLERVPKGAFAARFGGEEFVAFLPGAGLAEAGTFANALRQAFSSANGTAETGKVTASFGVAAAAVGNQSLHGVIGRADAALYAAKAAGRNRVMLEGEPHEEVPALHVATGS
ncbi:GGDEF domain-containing protein [Rhizobium sullae]|uniref:diguanylate cyclase n=1 Tax=Rhizobium sullae TaxID=50338 RepID=A0ABY5XNJ4_RHISU|nr:GGDEF domain-containing protein [Rhizobium sullae]UWU15744.1 GGDEF domain-containing protein [Rhizobium sullae]